MRQYHVVKDGKDWEVKINGRVVKPSISTKAAAVEEAVGLAKRNGGFVVPHYANGVIQDVRGPY